MITWKTLKLEFVDAGFSDRWIYDYLDPCSILATLRDRAERLRKCPDCTPNEKRFVKFIDDLLKTYA